MIKLPVLTFLLGLTVTNLSAGQALFDQWRNNPQSALLPDFSHAGFHAGNTTLPDLALVRMPVFEVEAYGAVPNDDISDQPAIQRAIDEAALAGGGIVRLGPGTYRINDGDGAWSLMIRHSNIILQGAGSDKTTIFSPGAMNRTMGPWTSYPMLLVAAPELKGNELQYGYAEGQPPMQHDWYESTPAGGSGKEKNAGRYFHVREKDILSTLSQDAPRNSQLVNLTTPVRLEPGDRVVLVLRSNEAAEDLLAPWDASRFPYLTWDGIEKYGTTANLVRQILTVNQTRGTRVAFKERLRWKFPVEHEAVLLRYPHIENIGIEGLKLKGVVRGGVPQTKTGLYFVNTANSWARDVQFINFKTALNITQSKNVTALDCVLDGEDGKTGSYFEGFHNSMKFLSHSSDCLIENGRILRGVTHGFSCQRHANGNVFLDCVLPPTGTDGMNSRIDFHSQLPWSNLYDGLKNGNLSGSGGNMGTQPHAGPLNVLWNWDSEISGEQKIWKGYGQFQLQLPRPVWVGLQGKGNVSVQFASETGPTNNEKVVAASIGKEASPSSLYRAQLQHRLGGRPTPGVYPFIQGPSILFAGTPATWQAAGTRSSSLKTYWNGSRTPGSEQLEATPLHPGYVPLTLARTHGTVEPMTSVRMIRVLDPKGTLIDARAKEFVPVSRNVLRTANGTLLQALHTGQHSELHLQGDHPYFRSRRHTADRLTLGSLMISPLPDGGISLDNYLYDLAVENTASKEKKTVLRLAACDAQGMWAMSDRTLSWDHSGGSFAGITWQALDENFGLPSGDFDSARIERIGFLMLIEDSIWTLKETKLRFVAFRVRHQSMN